MNTPRHYPTITALARACTCRPEGTYQGLAITSKSTLGSFPNDNSIALPFRSGRSHDSMFRGMLTKGKPSSTMQSTSCATFPIPYFPNFHGVILLILSGWVCAAEKRVVSNLQELRSALAAPETLHIELINHLDLVNESTVPSKEYPPLFDITTTTRSIRVRCYLATWLIAGSVVLDMSVVHDKRSQCERSHRYPSLPHMTCILDALQQWFKMIRAHDNPYTFCSATMYALPETLQTELRCNIHIQALKTKSADINPTRGYPGVIRHDLPPVRWGRPQEEKSNKELVQRGNRKVVCLSIFPVGGCGCVLPCDWAACASVVRRDPDDLYISASLPV
jgi:hypothetical protein